METALQKYTRLMAEMLLARANYDEPREDELLDRMDAVWLEMTPDERMAADELSGPRAGKG